MKTVLSSDDGKHKVTIYPNRNRTSFEIRCKVPGEGQRRHTKKTHEEALAHAEVMLALLEQRGGAVLDTHEQHDAKAAIRYLKDKGYKVPLYEVAMQYVRLEKKERERKTVPAPPSLGDAVFAYLDTRKHLARFNGLSQRLIKFADRFGRHAPINDISSGGIERELKAFDNPVTANSYRNDLKALFNFARTQGWLPHDQPTCVEKTQPRPVPPADPVPAPPNELRSLLAIAADEGKWEAVLSITLSAFCGLRIAETFRVRHRDFRKNWVNKGKNELTLYLGSDQTKTKKRRAIRVPGVAQQWLRIAIIKRTATEPSDKLIRATPTAVQKQISDLYRKLELAGYPFKRTKNGLRKGFITYSLARGEDPQIVAHEAGHSREMMETTYRGLSDKTTAEAWFNLTPKRVYPDAVSTVAVRPSPQGKSDVAFLQKTSQP